MAGLEEKPYVVSWNVTQRCNLACPHCYIEGYDGRAQRAGLENGGHGESQVELSKNEAMLLVDELSYLNSRLMLVLSGGEPLLRGDIFEIIEYASRGRFIIVMGSNGTLLTGEKVKLLKKTGLHGIGISLDSATPEHHDTFRGSEGAWELSTAALRSARAEGLETQLDVTLTDGNWDQIDRLVDLGAGLGARAVNFFFLVCTGRAAGIRISRENYDHALQHIARISPVEKRLMVKAKCAPHVYRMIAEQGVPIPEGARGCMAGRSYLRIDPLGNVTPCPYMPVVIGNVRTESLTTLWEGSKTLRLLREGKYAGRCAACEYGDVCGGCRARALAEKGDFMEEDPLCGYDPGHAAGPVRRETLHFDLPWEEEACGRIKKIPPFLRGMIVRMLEARARTTGADRVTSALIDQLKREAFDGCGYPRS